MDNKKIIVVDDEAIILFSIETYFDTYNITQYFKFFKSIPRNFPIANSISSFTTESTEENIFRFFT